jgi:hypothetical protein
MSKYCGPRLRIVRRLGEIKGLTKKSDNRLHYLITKKAYTIFVPTFGKTKSSFLLWYYGKTDSSLCKKKAKS